MADDDFGDAMVSGAKSGVQIGAAIGAAIAGLMMLLARPFVLVTQVLFRKELGERYFDVIQVYLSLLLIIVATAATIWSADVSYNSSYGFYFRHTLESDFITTAGWVFGILWTVAFMAATAWHFYFTLPRRGRGGIMWHSRSDGIPWFPRITEVLEVVIIGALMVLAYWFKLEGFAVLLTFSFLTTIGTNAKKKAESYNRVLDAIDGQIESEWLGKAIEEKLTPSNAHGLNAPLPAYISNDYRKKIGQMFKRPGPKITGA